MKIAIDARFYGLENAGLGRYTVNLIHSLSKIDKENEYSVLLRKKYFKELSLPGNFKKVEAEFQHYGFSEQLHLVRLLNSMDFDFVHFLHFNIPILFRGKYIVTIHDLLMHRQKGYEATTLNPLMYEFKRVGYRHVFSEAVKKACQIIVPTKTVKIDLTRYYKFLPESKISVIHEGIDAKFHSTEKDLKDVLKKYNISEKYFIYVGNAYPHKNLERVIEGVVQLNKSGKVNELLKLVIVTPRNVFRNRLAMQVSRYFASEHVTILGYVPDDELQALYKGSIAFVYPSLSEGFGLPGLEAMMSGTIALVSDIPVFHEVYKNQAIYFNPYDFSAIAKAMGSVVEIDKLKRKQIITKGISFVKGYSWEKMASETLELYKRVRG